jgi:hypothetical protein
MNGTARINHTKLKFCYDAAFALHIYTFGAGMAFQKIISAYLKNRF